MQKEEWRNIPPQERDAENIEKGEIHVHNLVQDSEEEEGYFYVNPPVPRLEALHGIVSFHVEMMEETVEKKEEDVVQFDVNGEKLEGRIKSFQSLRHTPVEEDTPLDEGTPSWDAAMVEDP